MRNSCERSVKETEPWRFRERRICRFADENPASSAPTSTSLAGLIAAESRPEIIYLMIYKIDVGRCRRREHGPGDLGRSSQDSSNTGRSSPPMRTRVLGRTGLQVSEIGFGAWAIGGNAHGNSYGATTDSVSIEAVRRAVELGVNFFDTADVYGWGHSEEILGQALKDRREDVFLATKVGGDFYHGGVRMNFDPGYLAFALDRSLQRLQTEHVDLYQLHNPPTELMGDPASYEVLDTLKKEHKIDHYGVSVHEPVEALLCLEAGKPEVLQIPFSLFRQEWIDEVFPEARRAGVGIIAREPLGNGFLTGTIRPG